MSHKVRCKWWRQDDSTLGVPVCTKRESGFIDCMGYRECSVYEPVDYSKEDQRPQEQVLANIEQAQHDHLHQKNWKAIADHYANALREIAVGRRIIDGRTDCYALNYADMKQIARTALSILEKE